MKMYQVTTENGRKGQGLVEYLLMIAAVILILLVFIGQGKGLFSESYNSVLETQAYDMEEMTNTVFF